MQQTSNTRHNGGKVDMNGQSNARPVQPGDPAPGFELPAVTREGVIRLDDYRGNRPLLLGLFRGLTCPFCRRHIAALSQLEGELRAKGVETLAVINTPADKARAFVRYHPMRIAAASDENRTVHHAYGLPAFEVTEDRTEWPRRVGMNDVMALRIRPTDDLPEPMNPMAAREYLDAKDGFDPKLYEAPQPEGEPYMVQLTGTFLVDRNGIVRWSFQEVTEGPGGFGGFPETRQFLAAAAALAS
jgi:peroxiredoxin